MKIHRSNSNHAFGKSRSIGSLFAVAALMLGAICFTSLLVLTPSASAQKATGTITGTVTDPSGAAVPGATVSVLNERTSATRSATTNEQGSFSFPELDAGMYTLSVSKGGFKKITEKNVELHVADVTSLNVKMEMGAAAETVVVEATAVVVNTQTGDVGNIMIGEQVRELPMNGRNFVQLTTLVPGAAVGEGVDNKNKGLFGSVDISFSGSPAVDNQWTVDGAGNNDIGSQRTILVYPSIDGIEEFKIQRNSYGPEYGGASGAQINIVTKGGSNQYHGDVYYFGRNDVLNAKNFFLQPCPAGDSKDPTCRKQLLRRNDFGYTVGGPVKKDKIYFFWSEEWNRDRRGKVHHHCVPTAAERAGDFSLPSCGSFPLDPETGKRFVDPLTGLTNDKIPASRLSPAGQAYVAPIALPSFRCLDPVTQKPTCTKIKGVGTDNWLDQVEIPTNWREENMRGDWNITKTTSLMLRYTQDAWVNFLHADESAGLWGDSDYPALSDTWDQPGKMAVAKITTTIGNTAVNDFQFSWSGNRIYISRAGDTPALNDTFNAAMPRIFPYTDKLHGDKVPIPVTWAGGAPGLLGILSPWQNRQDLFQWKDDFSKVAGKHTFKAGFLYTRNAKDEEVGDEGGEFWGGPAAAYKGWGGPGSTGNYYADYLVRGMMFGYDENQRDNTALVRWRDYEFYGGDTFKVSRRVTFNYGARWSIIRTPFLDDNKLAGFSPAVYASETSLSPTDSCRGMILAKGAKNTCAAIGSSAVPPFFENRSLAHNNNHMIAPRVGIAWDVFGTGRFAIRAGVGQFFSRDRLLAISLRSNNPPFGVNTGGLTTLDGPGRVNLDTGGVASDCIATTGCITGVSLGGTPHQGLDPSPKQANSWQWNLTTETALWKNSKLEVGWVANRGIHLHNVLDENQIPLAKRLQAAQLAVTGTNLSGTTGLFPYPFRPAGGTKIPMWSHRGDSIYHSLQAMYSNKFRNNSMLQVAYTWSKNLGNTTFGYVGADFVAPDNSNLRAGRGPVDFDRRHVFSATLIYNLPALTNSNALLRRVAGGWESNTIVNYASGNALTIQGNNGLGDASGTGTIGSFTGRPLRVAGQPCHLSSSPRNQWLNPAAFTWDGYQLGTNANTGQGQCAGPPIDDVDFAVVKNWKVTERLKMQLRLEMFNVFNHPQFRFNGQNISYNVTGAIPVNASGADCRPSNDPTTCVAIKGGILDPLTHFGQPQNTSQSGNREIQYALKFIF